jgi:hypothetical protein
LDIVATGLLLKILRVYVPQHHNSHLVLSDVLVYMNILFTLLFTVESALKLSAFGWRVKSLRHVYRCCALLLLSCFYLLKTSSRGFARRNEE